MTSERWNDFIYLVNNDRPITELVPPVQNAEEESIFNNMVKELAEIRIKDPKAAFWPVEKDWD